MPLSRNLDESIARLKSLASNRTLAECFHDSSEILVSVINQGGTVFSCGNGGSLTDSMHFAEELTGRFRENRRPIKALSISDPAHLTCVANDYGYEFVFSRFIEAFATSADVLIAISTSGKSSNVLRAAAQMKLNGGLVIALVGSEGSELGNISDVELAVGGSEYADRVQENHILILHSLVESLEVALAIA